MALEGNLQDMALTDLIQVFRMGPKSGILLLVSNHERGVIYVAAGRLVDAAVVRSTDRQMLAFSDEAVLHLLQWQQARFIFRPDPAALQRPVRITHDSEWPMLEGLRRRSSPFNGAYQPSITLDTRLELAPLPTSAESGVNLDLNQWRLLAQVSASYDLRELCAKTGLTPKQAIRITSELIAIGLIDIILPSPPTAKPTQREPRAAQPQITPILAGAAPSLDTGFSRPVTADRGLLNAIMRRIRGL